MRTSKPVQFLTLQEVCLRYRVSRSHIHKLLLAGVFVQPLRMGRALRWAVSDLEQWERQQQRAAEKQEKEKVQA